MQTLTWFCTTCGAANDEERTLCFACLQPHTERTRQEEQSDLLHDRYRLLTQVGVGGFGVVYRAFDTQSDDRVVAVKQINLRGLSPQKMIEATDAFNREVQILPLLKHPNLPSVYDHFTDHDHWYLVMEFLEGETLERYLEKCLLKRSYSGTTGLLSFEEILALAFQLCDVLDYLHTRQPPIVFRDVKPANIMRTGTGHLYLIDFGIARLFRPGQVRDTTPLGSPGYAAPEQYGRAQTTPRSDLYSLGALLHHLVTGDEPSDTPFQFAPLPQTLQAGMQELDALIRRLVDVDSSGRPTSAREVKEELQRIASLVDSAAPRVWHPPQAQDPDPQIVQSALRQVQLQVQKQKGTTRRKFLTRSMLGGGALMLGGTAIGSALLALLNEQEDHRGFRPWQGGTADFSRFPQERQTLSDLTWSPDGKQAAFVSTTTSAHHGNFFITNSVLLYQIEQGTESGFSPDPPEKTASYISALAWAPDSRYIAFGYGDGSISLWDTRSASHVLTYNGSSGQVENIAWSPDGKLIASGGVQEVVRICRASDGTIVSIYAGNSISEKWLLSWSPDSTRVVIENDGPDVQSAQLPSQTLQVWDVSAGKTLFTFADAPMLSVAWSPEGKLVASVDSDGKVYLWKDSDGKLITVLCSAESSLSQ